MSYAVIAFKAVCIAVVFVVFDVLSGGGFAMVRGEYKSSIMRKGAWHKAGYLGFISFFILLDVAESMIGAYIGFDSANVIPFTIIGCGILFWTEVMSIMENIDKTYPGMIPDAISKMLADGAVKAGVKDVGQHTDNDKETTGA